MLVDNINILKDKYFSIWENIKKIEDELDLKNITVEENKRGIKTLSLNKGEKKIYFNSKYNPQKEAETIINEYEDIRENTTVIFYGIGLGYHIEEFVKKYPDVNYFIYEPIPEILYTFLSNKTLKNIFYKNLINIKFGTDKNEMNTFLNELINKNKGEVLLIELPVHKKTFHEEYKLFAELFKNMLKNKRSGIKTNYAFQKRWILNGMKNFREVLNTPNILLNNANQFKGKTAMLVAAGPSLDEEIENLRYIKEKGLAYIFSVGWAISTLVDNNLYPHATTSYDPTKQNQKVFEKIMNRNIQEIPLVFGSSIGYETLKPYPGPKLHMITSQDSTAAYYLKSKSGEEIKIIMDAPNISVITIQLLYKLGFSKIILVGQNFAYKGDKVISQGITTNTKKGNIKVKDVYGNDVLTEEKFIGMRKQMEMHIKNFKEVQVINATKGGAHIEGTDFITLDKIIEEDFNESIANEKFIYEENRNYDFQYLKEKKNKMYNDYQEINFIISDLKNILYKIKRLGRNQNFHQIEKMYNNLDTIFKDMSNNDYFNQFILPMNRVYYGIFSAEINDVKYEKNKIKKAEGIINSFGKFIFNCEKDIKNVESVFHEINIAIDDYITIHQLN